MTTSDNTPQNTTPQNTTEPDLDTSQESTKKSSGKLPKNYYINNKTFYNAIVEYKEACKKARKEGKEDPQLPNYIGECFQFIANNLARKGNFAMYSFVDEMIADAVENCFQYFHNFNPEISSNPFAYFTQFTYFAFLRRIKREKKELYVKYKSIEEFGLLAGNELFEDVDGNMKPFEMYENISEYIQKYEESMRKEKEKNIPTKPKLKGLERFYETETTEDVSEDIKTLVGYSDEAEDDFEDEDIEPLDLDSLNDFDEEQEDQDENKQ